jgi:acyl carrier protein
MNDSVSMEKKIHDFVMLRLKLQDLSRDTDIFETGIVGSMFAVQLVRYLETQFNIELDDEDLTLDNFRSVAALTSLATHKMRLR